MKKQHITAEPKSHFQALWNRHFQDGENPEKMLRNMLIRYASCGMATDAEIGEHTMDYINLLSFFEDFSEACQPPAEGAEPLTQIKAA